MSRKWLLLNIVALFVILVRFGVFAAEINISFSPHQIFLPLLLKSEPPTPTPTATLPPEPTVTNTPQPGTTGNIVIIDIFEDGSGSSEPDEYVAIRNDDTKSIQVQGWTLRDIANHVYTFPAFVMQPGQECRVYTNQNHPEWCSFNYGSGSAIWNNSGDCAYLRDSSNTLVDDYCY